MNDKELSLLEPEHLSKPSLEMEATAVISLIAAVLSLFLFGWIAKEMRAGDTLSFDLAVRGWVHGFASPTLTSLMIGISNMGFGILIVEAVVAFAVFMFVRWHRAAIWLSVALVGGLALNLALKFAFQRPRPDPFFGKAPSSYSFPSGHALCSFCFYAVLAGLIAPRIRSHVLRVLVWMVAAILIFAIGFSRVYLGVHYPSDVIGG